LSVPAYRRISTLMRLPARPTSPMLTQIVEITAVELAAVLAGSSLFFGEQVVDIAYFSFQASWNCSHVN
jgi:hypothetical protein